MEQDEQRERPRETGAQPPPPAVPAYRGRTRAERWLRELWRSLVTYGATCVGPTACLEALLYAAPAASVHDPLVLLARADRAPGAGGPPPAHPERLRQDVPLTPTERLLASELWPAYYGPRPTAGDD
ncbi:DUF6059 family protein [Streptomyces longwoodensis]|uniref:DUF6059 family protein n=1 Tax=Streptomyces longwoodensis TaxID=68231 RepID=UPI0033C4F92A